jgi:hypothetical protein
VELVDIRSGKEPEKCFKITYNSGEVELVMATTMGSTEDLKEFITFYIEDDRGLELVCMINQFLIRKIETTLAPKVSLIVNGEKIYE